MDAEREITHYRRLGVEPDATADQIKRAFRALARQLHPDVSKAADAAARFAEIQAAYAVLSDATRRSEYDRMLAGETARGVAHYTWTNVADATATVRGPGPDEIDDLWQTFFARRYGTAEAAGKPPKRAGRKR